jgi:hypothetical protein
MARLAEECWRPVCDFEGLYEISDRGRVKSLARTVRRGRFQHRVRERILRGYQVSRDSSR